MLDSSSHIYAIALGAATEASDCPKVAEGDILYKTVISWNKQGGPRLHVPRREVESSEGQEDTFKGSKAEEVVNASEGLPGSGGSDDTDHNTQQQPASHEDKVKRTGWSEAVREALRYSQELDRLFPHTLTLDQKGSIVASQLTQFMSDYYRANGLNSPPKVYCMSERDLDVVLSCAVRTNTSDSRPVFLNDLDSSTVIVRVGRGGGDDTNSGGRQTSDKDRARKPGGAVRSEMLLYPKSKGEYRSTLALPWLKSDLEGMKEYLDWFSDGHSERLHRELGGQSAGEAVDYVQTVFGSTKQGNDLRGEGRCETYSGSVGGHEERVGNGSYGGCVPPQDVPPQDFRGELNSELETT
jgi:hypothetical protein